MQVLQLYQQFSVTNYTESEYDRFILRYHDQYLPRVQEAEQTGAIEQLLEPHTFFNNLSFRGEECRKIVNNHNLEEMLLSVKHIVMPVLGLFREACEGWSTQEPTQSIAAPQPTLQSTQKPTQSIAPCQPVLEPGQEPAQPTSACQPVFQSTVIMTYDNVDAIVEWLEWKDSNDAGSASVKVQEIDQAMYQFACNGQLEEVRRLKEESGQLCLEDAFDGWEFDPMDTSE